MSDDLCDALAITTRRHCNSYATSTLRQSRVCWLIVYWRWTKVLEYVIGECLGRVIGKTVTRKFRSYLTQATGPLSGSEAAVHEARSRLGDTDTCCILLVDAENAFNTVNRKVALQSVQASCPIVSKFTMNFFRPRNRHFLGRTYLSGEEGIAQGDPFAIIFYGLSVLPLTYFHGTKCKTGWFADDSYGGGKLSDVKA